MALLAPFKGTQGVEGFSFWCPGCRHRHVVYTRNIYPKPFWTWNERMDKPTFLPSMEVFRPAVPATAEHPALPRQTLCHFHVIDGMIHFLPDSSRHQLRGPVPMQEIPE